MNAYVLVGGRSSRMGRSKTGLFLPRIVAAASEVFDAVVAVQRPGGETVAIPTLFEEPHASEGAIFGVARALRDAQGDCFILAVDYPLVTAEVLRYLRDRAGIPVWNDRPQPLCARWPARALSEVEARVAEGRYDLHGIGGREIIPERELRERFPGEPLLNVNTPEELEEAERVYGQGLFPSR